MGVCERVCMYVCGWGRGGWRVCACACVCLCMGGLQVGGNFSEEGVGIDRMDCV